MYTKCILGEVTHIFRVQLIMEGGGGGILVNGRGPQNDLPYTGIRFGAGEGRCASAKPGVILVSLRGGI